MTRRTNKSKAKAKNKVKLAGQSATSPAQASTSEAPQSRANATGAHGSGPAFEMVGIPGKGMGLVAARKLEAGDLVLKESPLVVCKPGTESETRLGKILAQLSPEKAEAYISLDISPRHEDIPTFAAILYTNGIRLQGGDDDSVGVFAQGSRFNHSCRPNVNCSWDDEKQCEWFIAGRDIDKGEELCITYIDPKASKQMRQAQLKASKGFDCACVACTLSEEKTLVSDTRRVKIKSLDASTPAIHDEPDKLIPIIELALHLMEAEEITDGAAQLASEAMMAYILVGDRTGAIRWTRRLLAFEKKEGGIWASLYLKALAHRDNPQRHPMWNAKQKIEEIALQRLFMRMMLFNSM